MKPRGLYPSGAVTCLLLVGLSSQQSLGFAGICDNANPITEKAYNGAFSLDFPVASSISSRRSQLSRCMIKIQTYRKDYVVRLDFLEVSLLVNDQTGACRGRITVYDGPTTASDVIASFCRGTPEMVTSSDEVLVVFSPDPDHLDVYTTLFTVAYSAAVERRDGGDTSHFLRVGFGSFIGMLAFCLVCSGVCRKYKQAHPDRSFFQFSGFRTSSSATSGNNHGARRHQGTQPRTSGARTESVSLRVKIAGFFESIFQKLTPARYARENEAATSSEHTGATLTPSEQLRRAGQAVHLRNTRGRYDVENRRESSTGTSTGLDFDLSSADITGTVSPDNFGDHVLFGYQNIPTSSFTSDPAAVKPPTYEDAVNNVNPLYLYHNGSHINPAFNLKDESTDPATVFSPPPPYSEFLSDTAPPDQGHDLLAARNSRDLGGLGQSQRMTTVGPPVSSEVDIPRETGQSGSPGAQRCSSQSQTALSAPALAEVPQHTRPTERPESGPAVAAASRSVNHSEKVGQGLTQTGEVTSPGISGERPNGDSTAGTCLSAPTVNSEPNDDLGGSPISTPSSTGSPRTLLSLASSSPTRATAETQFASSLLDNTIGVGGARLRDVGRDPEVTVGVGGARVRVAAESRPTAALTPVYLSEDSEEITLTPRRSDETKPTGATVQTPRLTQVDEDSHANHTQENSPGV